MTDGTPAAEPVLLTERRGRVLVITFNRPEERNAINGAVSTLLVQAIAELERDPDLTVGVITGNGRGFCSGMDLKAFARGEDIGPFREFVRVGCTKPLIGAVEGFALAGGFEVALTCDLLVAAEGTRFGLPEVAVGLFAAAGGLVRLPSRVGFGKATEMILTGQPILADEAHQHGLVSRVTAKGEALTGALELAEQIARNAPLAVAASKQLLRGAHGLTEDEYWELQAQFKDAVFESEDAKEGPRAFAEKRPANWVGR